MSRLRILPTVAAAALAAAVAPSPAGALDVFLRSPSPFEPIFGEVLIEAEVLSAEPVASVVFRVDDELVARLEEPPWRTTVDVGQENAEHRIEATVTDALGETATAGFTTPAIAVSSELDLGLQQLYVTVTRGGTRALDLTVEDFTVLDQGERQELVTFEGGEVPLTAALLVDASLSMAGPRLVAALEGAEAFVAGMQPLDEATLMIFSDRLLHQTPFTGDPAVIAGALGAVEAQGGTSLNDHLYAALERLERHQGRRVVILLSDGVDIESVLTMEDVLWKAGRSQSAVYWIRLQEAGAPQVVARMSAWRGPEGHRRERQGLERLVRRTGGRVVNLSRIEDAAGAFGEILAELREQYVLGYYPIADLDDGSWHRVQVQVGGVGYRVRTREGYVDD